MINTLEKSEEDLLIKQIENSVLICVSLFGLGAIIYHCTTDWDTVLKISKNEKLRIRKKVQFLFFSSKNIWMKFLHIFSCK